MREDLKLEVNVWMMKIRGMRAEMLSADLSEGEAC